MANGCTRTATIILLSVGILVAVAICAFQLKLNADAERKISNVLTSHYTGHVVSVKGRRELSPGRVDYQFFYQVCFDLLLDRRERRTAMVRGDDDGGSFTFGGEYPSMQACEAHFIRG